MKRIAAAFAVVSSCLLFAPAARSQTARSSLTFTAVDAVKVDHDDLHVTGVLEGEATQATRTFFFYISSTSAPWEQRQSCERLAILAMARPGYYTFNVTLESNGYPSCTLRRATP